LEGRGEEREEITKILAAVIEEVSSEWVEIRKNKLSHAE